MSVRNQVVIALLTAASLLTACSQDSSVTQPTLTAAFQGGSATGGGGGGGGGAGGGSVGGGGNSTPTPVTAGPPVAPTYVARINAIGVVPAGLYYGTPSDWTVGGYVFKSAYLSSFKPVNGPIVVGACVSVTFVESEGVYWMSELKTLQSGKCG